jgi:hypothetical protein
MHDPLLEEALYRAATEGGGKPMALGADLDRSTVLYGSPGIFNGLVIAQWVDQ